ncbi:hypothetical protein D917_09230 [Trichinella nativa]|uniref:Uncharacterized protein n=1 Tax=Trichinella nativa TaxID=6335 RepID=A0A1Y3EHY7_9BILA|nr:hypothetical protein D917_09230 [Trichinella nativa]
MSSRVRYKRQAQGYGIWNPMFHNTEYLPYMDMGNVHFWSDGWLLPPNVYASDLGPFEFYPVGTWIDFLPGLSDSPAVLGGRGNPLINSPALLYPDPGNVRFWGGGYRPVLAGAIYGMPISMPPTAGFLQPLLHGQQNYINSQTLASYNPLSGYAGMLY